MIIDFHTHTFPEKIAQRALKNLEALSHTFSFTDGTPDGLVRSMETHGIDFSVVLPVATSPQQTIKINDASARLNGTYGERGIISFGAMHPDLEGWREELVRIRQLGLKGIKLHPPYQKTAFDDIRYLRILDRCAELGLLVITHSGYDPGYPEKLWCSPDMVIRALREIRADSGDFTLILAHMGGWRCWSEVREKLPGYPVMMDTSCALGKFHAWPDGFWKEEDTKMLGPDDFMEMVRAFGAERLLFGSDSPWAPQNEVKEIIEALPLTAEEKQDIFGRNAARLLGIDR